jgi:hypothetical protein
MPVLDTQGRLFGRINLVDAVLIGFGLLLIPIAYAAWLLFQPPKPTITSVEAAQLTITEERAAQGTQLAGKLKVRGNGLRPVFRATIGGRNAIAYIFENPTSADVLFGDLPAGTHDLVLLDGVQEVARAERAVVIPEKPRPAATQLVVAGMLIDMAPEAASALKVGATYPQEGEALAEIIALGPPEPASNLINGQLDTPVPGRVQRSAGIRVRCEGSALQPHECRAGGVLLVPGTMMVVPGTTGALRQSVDELLPSSAPIPAELRVRFAGPPAVIDMMHVDDVDVFSPAVETRAARITALSPRRSLQGTISMDLSQDRAPVLAGVSIPDRVDAVDVTLRLGLDQGRHGWRYRSQLLRAGGPITFTTRDYVVRGVILSLSATAPGEHRR